MLLSTRWEEPVLRRITLLLSVALPVFGIGNFLARLHVTGLQKLLLLTGVLMLIVGGLATVADFPGTFSELEEVPTGAWDMSRWVGALGLFAGLIAILFAVVRGEEELAEIGDRFRYLTEHMSEGFTLSAPDGTILMVNRRLLDMTGLKRDEVVGRNAHEMVKELDHQTIMEHLEERKHRRASEYVISHQVNGEERHFAVSGTPIFNRRGEHAGTVATFRDVTEQIELSRSLEKYAEGLQRLVEEQTYQLRESEERLRGLLLHMNEGFLTLDTAFRVRFANERICEMLGLEASDLVGRDVFGFLDPAGRSKLLNLLKAAGSSKTKRLQQETNLVTQRRGLVPVVLGVSQVEDSREGGVRYSLVVTDVSKQKEMQHQLEQRAVQLESANEELRILDRTKDSFLTNVTHELRTPLSTIRGYVEMIDSESIGVLDKEQKDALKVISRNAQRLGTLIEEMIEFSRMQMRGFRLKFTLFNVEGLVEECVNSIRPTATQHGLTVKCNLRETLPRIWGDRARLAQVLTNLLSNAVKFTERGGKVEVAVTRAPGGTVLISVSDTGIGISPEYQDRIFDKFFQVDDSLERRYEGAGIGLSIAKSIADAHGGTIRIASQIGEGSKFTVVLPDVCFDESYSPSENARIESRKLACVSDDSSLMERLGLLLESWGAHVERFPGGHEAIRAARESVPDLVIVDETTDDVKGPAFVTLLQRALEAETIPVILMQGQDAALDEGNVELNGSVEILEKPFHAQEFFWKVHRMLGNAEVVSEMSEAVTKTPAESSAQLMNAIVEPDRDLLEWLQTALSIRGIETLYFANAEEALARLEHEGARMLLLDIDGLSGEQFTRFKQYVQHTHTPMCAITGSRPENKNEDIFDAVLIKPFSVEDLVETITELNTPSSAVGTVAEHSKTADGGETRK
ncbi:MAG: PAS domain S-box protein [Candidatus Hydrogenedentota bacterium]